MHKIDKTRPYTIFYEMGRKCIRYTDSEIYWEDNGQPYSRNNRRRCKACGLSRKKSGHDPCIENLPGVKFACCGHGIEPGYIYFENGTIVRGDFNRVDWATVNPKTNLIVKTKTVKGRNT